MTTSNEELCTAYRKTFTGKYGSLVLEDLSRFCRLNETCFHPDQRVHAVKEGRREVILRIKELSDKDAVAKYRSEVQDG